MAFIVKTLTAGVLVASGTANYLVPNNRSALVTSVRLVNSGGTSPVVDVLVQPSGGVLRYAAKKGVALSAGSLLTLEETLTLSQGDTLQVSVVTPGVHGINYSMFGVERD